MIIAVQIHVRMRHHVSIQRQIIIVIALRTGKGKTVVHLVCSARIHLVKVHLLNRIILHVKDGRGYKCRNLTDDDISINTQKVHMNLKG